MQTWLCHSSAVDVALRIKTKILNWPIKWAWSDPCWPLQSCPPLLCPHWPPFMCPQCLCTCYSLCLASFQVTPTTLHLLSTYSICSLYLLMYHNLFSLPTDVTQTAPKLSSLQQWISYSFTMWESEIWAGFWVIFLVLMASIEVTWRY